MLFTICRKCSFKVHPDAAFCGQCGARVIQAAAQTSPLQRLDEDNRERVALIWGALGLLLCAPCSFIAIAMGKRGGAAQILGVVGITAWAIILIIWYGGAKRGLI